jgi:HEAT repeat protein
MTMHKKLIGWALIIILALAGSAAAQDQGKDKELYDAAKKAVYQKDWYKAVEELQKLEKSYGKSGYMGESLYWMGYSLDKMAASLDDMQRRLETKQEAMAKLNRMLDQFGGSQWAKDARILQIQIANDLVKNGLNDYRKYINGSIQGGVDGAVRKQLDAELAARIQGGVGSPKKLDPDEEIKLVALNALMGMDKEKAFPILEKMVRSEKSDEVRNRALFVLSQSNDPKVIPLLADLAIKDPSPQIREQAVFWLGQHPGDESFEALLRIYGSGDKKVKEKIFFSFSQMHSPKATAKLIEIAKTETDPDLRGQAVFWLGQKSDEASQAALFDIYTTTQDTRVKENLIMGFAQSKSPKAKAKLLDIARSDKDDKARERAIFWLSQSRGDDVAPALLDIYKKTDDAKIKKQVIFAISQNRGEKAVPVLIEMARAEKDLEVKKQIIFWLGQSKSDEAIKFLRELLEK